ncbi:hypothetical protein N7470_004345 [Penicillium chermesinum]|nr:hypothetical protein N7470_004345 [Penicillium chermesinum]
MKNHKTGERPPEPSEPQFKTPSRPSRSTAGAPSTSKRTAPLTSERQWKRSSLSGSRAQSTLTQIDFVTQTTQSDNDYIGGTTQDEANNHGEPIVVDDNSASDSEHLGSLPVGSSLARTKYEMNDDRPRRRRKNARATLPGRAPSIRKSQTPKARVARKGKGNSTEKQPAKRDKTLTQMDFVRRYITIDDDNDMNLGYLEPAPARDSTNTESKVFLKKDHNTRTDLHTASSSSTKRNRRELTIERDLSTGEPLTSGGHSQLSGNGDITDSRPNDLKTPRKFRKLEIPSSQSPESPGLAIITSSQFRSATRSPAKKPGPGFHHIQDSGIKKESPTSPKLVKDSNDQASPSPMRTPREASPKVLIASSQHPSTFAQRLALCATSTALHSQQYSSHDTEAPVMHNQRERTVVYETDAETDQSEPECDDDQTPATPSRTQRPPPESTKIASSSPVSRVDDSHDLPLPSSGRHNQPDFDSLSEAPMSDASVYYQRMQPATQFPHEPIPSLNTQKLSELFPNEGGTQYPQQSHGPNTSEQAPGPFIQTQTQSQEINQTEIVPESSPVREQDGIFEDNEVVFQRPRAPESLVQVESSQPVERRPNGAGMLFSRSQLLTSSIMESVPLPNFCMSSQDSVGEPYSLPDQ